MIAKDAVRSLKDSGTKAFFYFLTFYLTSALIFLFLNMAESSVNGVAEIYRTNNMADLIKYIMQGNMGNIMMVFVVVICSVDIIFTNDFYVRTKAKELAVRLISGATYTQLLMFILIQTFIILAAAIPLGVITGIACIPLLNHFLTMWGSEYLITIRGYAIAEYVSIILFLILWITMLNASFAYKNGAVLLLSGNRQMMQEKEHVIGFRLSKVTDFLGLVFWFFIYLLPIIFARNGTGGIAVFAVAGCFGLDHLITGLFLPALTRYIRSRRINKPVSAYCLGFLRQDINMTRITLHLLIADTAVLIAMFFTRGDSLYERMVILVTFIFVSILQAFTLMFRLESELSHRKKEFRILEQTGFDGEQLKHLRTREIVLFYVCAAIAVMIYLIAIFRSLLLQNMLQLHTAFQFTAIIMIPLVIACVMSVIYYSREMTAAE
jgi:hypothetical protein